MSVIIPTYSAHFFSQKGRDAHPPAPSENPPQVYHIKRLFLDKRFTVVLVYMGDKTNRNKDPDIALWEIVTKAWANQPLRDELYFQLIKQTTDNNSS